MAEAIKVQILLSATKCWKLPKVINFKDLTSANTIIIIMFRKD